MSASARGQAQGAADRAKQQRQQQHQHTKPGAGAGKGSAAKSPAPPFPVDTITTLLKSDPRVTLVKGFAGRGELILFYGPPKHGKTFLASHFAISVAVGANWFGRKPKAPPGFSCTARWKAARACAPGSRAYFSMTRRSAT
jgi:hypothetical protein